MADQQTIDAYDQAIRSYEELTRTEQPDPILLAFIEQVVDDGYVLDLGCGPALASATMREHGLRVDPVDASPEMVALANKNHNIGARIGLFSSINQNQVYDGVWANFSLLHAHQSEFSGYLRAVFKALKPDGCFHIGMKTGRGESRDRLGRRYAYYSSEQLTDLLTNTGFHIIGTVVGEGMGLAGDVEPWITVLSKKTPA